MEPIRRARFLSPRSRLGIGVAAALLAGCTAGPDYRPPRVAVPGSWAESASPGGTAPAAGTAEPPRLADWWKTLRDPILDRLIERAVRSNPDLRMAQARVREARARRGVVEADRLPAVDAAGSYERSRPSRTVSGGSGPSGGLYQAGFDASWEIDLFGGVRREIEAADADVGAAVEDRRDALVSLLAEVARDYVDLRGAQRRASIARSSLQAQRETLGITRTRLAAGLATDLDVARAEAQVQTTASQVPALEAAARRSIHLLSVLLAAEPGALAGELGAEAPIPVAPASVPVGLPSDLLRRRPDVRRAERRLAAATARIGAATADLFPRFSLTGSFGLESGNSGSLADRDSRFWSVGPAVRWPLLDFGKVRSNIAVQDALEEQAAVEYERTILSSLREVEDGLVSFAREQDRRAALAAAVESNRRAVGLADSLYRQGSTDFLSVLQVERDLFQSQDALAQSDGAVTSGLVALYKALGGGWEAEALAGAGSPRGEAGRRVLDLSSTATDAKR
jgi:NodT family efflux transporter outer membrane factor (OMF) lipoprotein